MESVTVTLGRDAKMGAEGVAHSGDTGQTCADGYLPEAEFTFGKKLLGVFNSHAAKFGLDCAAKK